MFKVLRKKKFVQITMWSLVVIFATWGLGSVTASRKNYAGIIFGKKVSMQEYNRSYRAVLSRAKIVYGDNLSKMEKFLNLRGQAWDRLILKYEAKKRRLRASNKEIIERVAASPFFQRNGVFDERAYQHIVENIFGVSRREFEESVRDDIIIEKLIDSITKDIELTEDEIKDAYRAENEVADVSYILVKPDDYKKDITVNDEELLLFYKEHEESFRSPVSLNVIYLRIPFNGKKEEAHLAAEELMSNIKKGKSLEEVSKKYGLDLKETGDFSIDSKIPEIGLSYPFILAAVSLDENQISDIVETNDSFYIMKLKSKKLPSLLPFEEAKNKVRDMAIAEKASLLAEADAERILNRIKKENKSLKDIAKELNCELLSSKQITRKGYVEEVGLSNAFAEVAFSLKAEGVGGPAKTSKGYAIIRLDSLETIDEDKFKKDKDAFATRLMENKKREFFLSGFLDLKKKAALEDNLSRGGR